MYVPEQGSANLSKDKKCFQLYRPHGPLQLLKSAVRV